MNRRKISQFISLFLLSALFIFTPLTFAQSKVVVEMTADGFKPQLLELDNNSTVIFINKDSLPHWPASNLHPTHDLYPEFDPQKAIEPNKGWTFKFQKVGEWKYHDHLNSHRGGVIKVVAKAGLQINQPVAWVQNLKTKLVEFLSKITSQFVPKSSLDPLKFTKSSSADQISQLKKFADSNGAEKTWQFIKEAYKGQAGSLGNIHDLAHFAGGLLFEKEDFKGIGQCSADFAFGCYHGFLDKAFAKNLDHLLDAEDACMKLGPNLSGPAASCIHGIGHGVASFHLSTDLQKSLSDCRKLISGQEYCFDGVFMEFVRSAPDNFYKKDDPLYPCDELEQHFGPAYSLACGRNQPSLFLGRFKMSFDDVVKICLDASSTLFKQACFDALGFSLASTNNPDQIIRGCQIIGVEEYVVRCEKSAAGELIFQNMPGWQQKSSQICNSLPEKYSAGCFQYLDQLIKQYNRK